MLKILTGNGDPLHAAELYTKGFDFIPRAKVILYGNHKPTIRGTDTGIWRRVRLIPFTQRFEGDRDDRNLGKNSAPRRPAFSTGWWKVVFSGNRKVLPRQRRLCGRGQLSGRRGHVGRFSRGIHQRKLPTRQPSTKISLAHIVDGAARTESAIRSRPGCFPSVYVNADSQTGLIATALAAGRGLLCKATDETDETGFFPL